MKKNRAIRRLLCIFTLLLTLGVIPLRTAAFGETSLTIQIPKTHSVTLRIHGRGSVQVGDTVYTRSDEWEVERLSSLELALTPGRGRYIRSVYCNGSALKGDLSTLSVSAVTEDLLLEVYFDTIADNPATGDDIALSVACMAISGTLLALILKQKNAK